VFRVAGQQDHRPHRDRVVRSKRLTQRRERESTVGIPGEYRIRGQSPHEPKNGIRVGADSLRHFVRRQRSRG
jgi:hypothetical protein